MNLTTSQKRFGRLLLYVVGVLTILLVLWPISNYGESVWVGSRSVTEDGTEAIRNGSLGVGKVLVVNLPSRPDKRDDMILGSSVSDFHVEFIDGVTPEQISPQSYPYNWNYDHQTSEYAARRAHLNGMQRIVDERLGSALIMEDDADWDVTIKAQLQSFALAVRSLQGTANYKSTASPYGDDWDILWLAHCGIQCRTNIPFFLTPNDPTILPPHHFLPYWRESPPVERPDHTRLTCSASDGVCSIAYAVSNRGAQKILAALSVNPSGLAEEVDTGAQFDVSLGRMCGNGYLKCFAPYPSLMGGYHKTSDIHAAEGVSREKPSSYGVMYSTMMNIRRILDGSDTVVSNWDDAAVPVVNPDDIPVLGGIVQTPGENKGEGEDKEQDEELLSIGS